ncbi:preprotein translocase subunit SecG [Patescibacteria group bacterium]|nr:preprotein translocase subunit SecG [Patescibacteria group bacterium]
MQQYLLILQIIVSILLIICIALQQRGTALGSAFGGSSGGEFYASRRGLQKKLFYATIGLSIIFIILGIINLLI